MYKLIVIFLFSYILTGCNTEKEYLNIYEFNNHKNFRLTDENIMEKFLQYWVINTNPIDTDNFTTYVVSNRPSSIQQYYYIKIMYLLTGEYNNEDFEILRELVFDQRSQFMLPIMLFILENSNALNENEVMELKAVAESIIVSSDINSPEFSRIGEYIYSVIILNYIDGYSTNEAINFIHNKLLQQDISIQDKIVYLYYYTILDNGTNKINNEGLLSILNNILEEYSTEDRSIIEIYRLTHLINYFNLNNTLGINQVDFLALMLPDLSNVYTLLSIYYNIGILDEEIISQLILYYNALYNEEYGFGSFVYDTNNNLNYTIYLLLGHMLDLDLVRFPVIDNKILSSSRNLTEDSYMKLLAISLLQLKEQGELNNNIQREVISRLKDVPLEDAFYNRIYYLFLIAYYGEFINEAINATGLDENEFELYLIQSLKEGLTENNIIYATKYLDILTLFYPDNKNIYNLYYQVRNLFYDNFKAYEKEDSFYSTFSLLKTIEFRIDKFENNFMIDNIFDKVYVYEFLILYSWDIKNIKSYYLYYYVNRLYNNQNEPYLHFLFLY